MKSHVSRQVAHRWFARGVGNDAKNFQIGSHDTMTDDFANGEKSSVKKYYSADLRLKSFHSPTGKSDNICRLILFFDRTGLFFTRSAKGMLD